MFILYMSVKGTQRSGKEQTRDTIYIYAVMYSCKIHMYIHLYYNNIYTVIYTYYMYISYV